MKTLFLLLIFNLAVFYDPSVLYIDSINEIPSNDSLIVYNDSIELYMDGTKHHFVIISKRGHYIKMHNYIHEYDLFIKKKSGYIMTGNKIYELKFK